MKTSDSHQTHGIAVIRRPSERNGPLDLKICLNGPKLKGYTLLFTQTLTTFGCDACAWYTPIRLLNDYREKNKNSLRQK